MKRLSTVFGLVLSMALDLAWAADLTTFPVESRAVPVERVFDATVEAVNQATVSAQVSGRIVEINFDVHDFVPRDSVILRFKSTEQRSQLEVAAAGLREAEARLSEAQIELERVTRIYERRLVSKAVLDRARADREAAKARVDSADANVERAREQLGYTEVHAPYAGIVVKRFVEVGESVTVGQPLMAGISLERLRVTVMVPQAAVGSFNKEAGVRVAMPDGKKLDIAPDRITVFPFADAATHSVRVRIDLPDGVEGLRPGALTKVVFPMGAVERLLVPHVAVVRRSELVGVYVVGEDGVVTLRQVRVGRRGPEDRIEVLAGLEAGERVAIDPLQAALSLKQVMER